MSDNFLINGTNFNVSSHIFQTLYNDCIYFGFIKNDKPNISGFLNQLIHHLSYYREDLHNEFLNKNNNDLDLVLNIEKNIYNTYLKNYDISNSSKYNIQLRINKEYMKTFIKIVDCYLEKYKLDFTNYIRTLLFEYSLRPLCFREYLHIYTYSKILFDAKKNNQLVKIRLAKNIAATIVPAVIEKDFINNEYFIAGYTKHKEQTILIKYSDIVSVNLLNDYELINEEDYKNLLEIIFEFFELYASDNYNNSFNNNDSDKEIE
ncbi:MAG: hypothetical protein IJW82_02805 [Clostridia bacterium]|nr:hypothetical protein [Clostridia bacterium]